MNYNLFKKCAEYLTSLKVKRGHKSEGYWKKLYSFKVLSLFFKPLFFLRKVDTIVLTYSTFKRHLKDNKYLDPIVEYVIKEVDDKALVLEKNQRFLRFFPSFYNSNELNVLVLLFCKGISLLVAIPVIILIRLLTKFNLVNFDARYLRIYIETHIVAVYFMFQLLICRPKQIYFASQFSIESMAMCIACNVLKIKCSEIQHGNIIKSSPLYNFSYTNEQPRFFAKSFVVKNEVVKGVLLEVQRAVSEADVTVMPSKVKPDIQSQSLLVCLGITDIPASVESFIDKSSYKKVIVRPHPGFKDLELSDFDNLSSLLKRKDIVFSENNSIESDLSKTSCILSGASTVIIDGCTSGHNIYTWDTGSLEQYEEYKTLINLI
jgi:hypothetical protein